MSFPATRLIGCTHERTTWPFTCTVHAPQSAIPQPNLVPVRPIASRITHSRGVYGSTSTEYVFPLTRSENMTSASQLCGDSRGSQTVGQSQVRAWQLAPRLRRFHRNQLDWRTSVIVWKWILPTRVTVNSALATT